MHEIAGIGHVAIRVRDVERTLHFYEDALGFEEMFRLDREGRLWIVYLRISDHQFLEIFPDADGDRAPRPEANGLNHLCLEVSDIDAVLVDLAVRGVRPTAPKKLGLDGNWQAWLEDPDGNRIELMQLAPDSLQAKAIERLRRERSG